jgi:hypothetical protein
LGNETFAGVLEAYASAFLSRAVKWVDAGEPWATIAAAARSDNASGAGHALGAWLAEDVIAQGRPQGALQASEARQRAASAERAVQEAVASLVSQGESSSGAPAAAEARETLLELFGGESDAISEALHAGFGKSTGWPLVAIRRDLALTDVHPEGPRNERVRFAKPVAPPPGLALEPLAHLRQDVARLKHYALHDAASRGGRPLSIVAASSYFKVIRPPVSLDGDLSETRAMSGVANAADAWSDAVRDALKAGFEERIKQRQGQALLGPLEDLASLLRSLEIERAAADFKGALAHQPEASVIAAEGLLALIIAAPLPTGGLTP